MAGSGATLLLALVTGMVRFYATLIQEKQDKELVLHNFVHLPLFPPGEPMKLKGATDSAAAGTSFL